MTAPLVVVKLGGRALEAPAALAELAQDLCSLAGRVVLVHGGGREVTDWCARLGIASRFAGGRRVTDAATRDVVVAVLAGLANARLTAALRAHGVDALGLNALDGGIVEAASHPDAAVLGAVGAVTGVRLDRLDLLLAAGMTPVMASIAAAADGELLNVNADDLAAALAAAAPGARLVLLSDVDGVRIDGAARPRLTTAELASLVRSDAVRDGMIPKLEAARTALRGGATEVVIGAWNGPGSLARLLDGVAPATRIVVAPEEALHG